MADDNKDKDKDNKDSAAIATATGKPTQPGSKDGEEKDGHVWDKSINDWRDNRPVDFNNEVNVPLGFEKIGDGSPERPHQVRQQSRWNI